MHQKTCNVVQASSHPVKITIADLLLLKVDGNVDRLRMELPFLFVKALK
jgi:hypothetical protein